MIYNWQITINIQGKPVASILIAATEGYLQSSKVSLHTYQTTQHHMPGTVMPSITWMFNYMDISSSELFRGVNADRAANLQDLSFYVPSDMA